MNITSTILGQEVAERVLEDVYVRAGYILGILFVLLIKKYFVLFYSILFYFILSYLILFHFISFHFILFYFIIFILHLIQSYFNFTFLLCLFDFILSYFIYFNLFYFILYHPLVVFLFWWIAASTKTENGIIDIIGMCLYYLYFVL